MSVGGRAMRRLWLMELVLTMEPLMSVFMSASWTVVERNAPQEGDVAACPFVACEQQWCDYKVNGLWN